jgi:hypothetical protein
MCGMQVAVKTRRTPWCIWHPFFDQELQVVGALAGVYERVPGLLDRPCGGGVGGDVGQVDAAIAVLDDEQNIRPAGKDGVDVEGGRPLRLSWPGRAGTAASGACASRCEVDAGLEVWLPTLSHCS